MPVIPGFKRHDQEGDRQYEWDGTLYPSVTTILKMAIPKPGLDRWQAKLVAQSAIGDPEKIAAMRPAAAEKYLLGLADAVKDTSSAKGSAVHAYAEAIAFGKEPPAVTEEEQMYVDSLERFLYDFAPEFEAVELPVFNETYGYAGTADIYAVVNGRMCVIDIKTGRSVWPEVALQLAAYARSEFAIKDSGRTPSPVVERGYVLHLAKERYDLRRVDIDDGVFNVFLSALDIYNWHRIDSKYNVGGSVELPDDYPKRVA